MQKYENSVLSRSRIENIVLIMERESYFQDPKKQQQREFHVPIISLSFSLPGKQLISRIGIRITYYYFIGHYLFINKEIRKKI